MTSLLQPSRSLSGKTTCIQALQVMYETRFMDEKMSKLIRQNKGGNFHLSVLGHEMIGALCALALTPGKDWGLPYYRDRAFAIGLGCSLKDILGALLARNAPHHSGGRMMPEHFSEKKLRIPCQSSCVGSQFLQAVGVAKGMQLSGGDEIVYVSAGEGATSQGDFHEALNFASLHKLNVLFVIQDNGWAISVPVSEQTAGGSIAAVARGYAGLSVHEVDGCDFEEISCALVAAVEKGRRREGPSLLIARVPRIGAHSSSDDPSKYKTQETIFLERQRDPLPRYEKWLLQMGLMNEQELELLRQECFDRVQNAAEEAETMPFPEENTAATKVFQDLPIAFKEEEEKTVSGAAEAVVMVDALNHALHEEMRKDPDIVVFGEDVAHGKGGVFGVTRNLTAAYGVERCFNTPLAESTIIALALGMSLTGKKPVAEIQFADYLWTGINQLFNELASFYYRSDGEWNCPVVIRMPYGGYIQGGPYHSQSIEAFLAHCPGLKVVIPSNAADAKKLLKASIRDPNPVMFLEHKGLYRQRVFCARTEPSEEEIIPLGKAKVVRPGRDVTFVGWGMMIVMAVEVAEQLRAEEIDVEIIDLRTIVPLDMETVLTSVRKTGKILVAHEAPRQCGFGAEIAARVCEEAFEYLDAPVMRLAAENCPVAYSKILEDAILPQREDVAAALRNLAGF